MQGGVATSRDLVEELVSVSLDIQRSIVDQAFRRWQFTEGRHSLSTCVHSQGDLIGDVARLATTITKDRSVNFLNLSVVL